MPSDFPRHHRSTSPDRAEVLMVVLVTIASVVVCGWIAVWLLSDVGAAWLVAVAGLPSRCSQRASEPSSCDGSTACSLNRPHPARVVDSPPSAAPVETFAHGSLLLRHPVKGCDRGAVDGASALVGVNVVRPVGRSTLTPRARRRGRRAVPGARCFSVAFGTGSVVDAGPGCGLSEAPTSGVRSVTLDCRVVPECPPGSAPFAGAPSSA